MNADTKATIDDVRALSVEIGRNMVHLEVHAWLIRHSQELSLEAMQDLYESIGLKGGWK